MEIQPVGPPQVPQPKNEGSEKHDERASKVERHDIPDAKRAARREQVVFSQDAQKIRDLQKDVSRIQVAERVAHQLSETLSRIVKAGNEIHRAQQAGRTGEVGKYKSELDTEAKNLREIASNNKFEGKDLLNGSPIRLSTSYGDVVINTPDITRDPRDVMNDILAITGNEQDKQLDRQLPGQIKRFLNEAGEVRKSLEKEVRDAVASAVKDSSASVPRDVQSAEKLLNDLRQQSQVSNPVKPASTDTLEGRTIDLLK